MKKNNLFFALFILAAGCTKKTPETLISRWTKITPVEKQEIDRKLAGGGGGILVKQCMRSVFNVETLKAEVKSLERQYSAGEKVQGQWKHIDLSTLPVPQANFLNTYGHKIGDFKDLNSIDYSSCNDVPCIFNKIYGKDDYVAGYVHYLWYLKLGHLLAADNDIPVAENDTAFTPQGSKIPGLYNDKSFPLESYLYNEKELFGFWRLSHVLKDSPVKNLSDLKEIQKIPRGQRLLGAKYDFGCGMAYSQGWILVTDGCVSLNIKDDDQGNVYESVTHELVHQLDFQQGKGTQAFFRSHKKDYLDLTGFSEKQYIGPNGNLIKDFVLNPAFKHVSNYAKGAPQENFAETVMAYQIFGSDTKKKISKELYDFVGREYYDGKNYQKENFLNQWLKEYSSLLNNSVFESVLACSKNETAPRAKYYTLRDFKVPVGQVMLNCINSRALEISESFKNKIFTSEPYGCLTLDDNTKKANWSNLIKEHLRAQFEFHLQEIKNDKEYLARIERFFVEIADKAAAQSIYLNCYGEKDEKACYELELNRNALELTQLLKLPSDLTKEFAAQYASHHVFDKTKNETKNFYYALVQSNLESLKKDSEQIWSGCAANPHNDTDSPSGNLFYLANGYLISSFYNCLNTSIPDVVKTAVRGFTVDGMNMKSPKEEALLTDFTLPVIVNFLQETYELEKKKEVQTAADFMINDLGTIRNDILSNLDWIEPDFGPDQIVVTCKKLALGKITFKPLFHLNSELFKEYLEKTICANIEDSKEYLQKAEDEKMVEKLLDSLETLIKDQAKTKAEACLVEFPMTNFLNKIRYRYSREACLEKDWIMMEESVLNEFKKDPKVIKLKISHGLMLEKLDSFRERTKKEIISTHFPVF